MYYQYSFFKNKENPTINFDAKIYPVYECVEDGAAITSYVCNEYEPK